MKIGPQVISRAVATPVTFDSDVRSSCDIGGSLTAGGLPYDAASFLAELSALIYSPAQLLDARLSAARATAIRRFERGRTLAVGFVLDHHAFLVFRGTVPQSLEDWWTDAKCWYANRPRRHAGFWAAWQRAAADVRDWIHEWPEPVRGLVTSGHSLGGALATLAAFDLSDVTPIAGVIVFGAPRVGGWAFRRQYCAKATGLGSQSPTLAAVTWRFINRGDLVAAVPPPLLYWHVGQSIGVCRPGTAGTDSWQPVDPKASKVFADRAFLATRTDSHFERIQYVLDQSTAPATTEPTGTWVTLSFAGSQVLGAVMGPAGWAVAALVRGLFRSGADHPCHFYVQALPPNRERVWVQRPKTS